MTDRRPYAVVRGGTLLRRYDTVAAAIHDAEGKPPSWGICVVYAPSEDAGPLTWGPIWHRPETIPCTKDPTCMCSECWEREADRNRDASDDYAREMGQLYPEG